MKLHKATHVIPDKYSIEPNVLYVGEHTYELNGPYRFWCTGNIKIGTNTVVGGYYTGIEKTTVKVPKGGGILFDRYPVPEKKQLSPAPVPDIIEEDNNEDRLMRIMEFYFKQNLKDSDNKIIDEKYVDEETEDLFVSENFTVSDYDFDPETGEIVENTDDHIAKPDTDEKIDAVTPQELPDKEIEVRGGGDTSPPSA